MHVVREIGLAALRPRGPAHHPEFDAARRAGAVDQVRRELGHARRREQAALSAEADAGRGSDARAAAGPALSPRIVMATGG
jgi:hypothetical protein